MNFYDNEMHIIEDLRLHGNFGVCLYPYNKDTVEIADKVLKEDFENNWTNSSGKSEPPPDFYSDNLKLMMEVMRLDDHAYVDKSGKIINLTVALESKLTKEVFDMKWYKKRSNKPDIIVNASTWLPSHEDHNYKRYYQNFQRVVKHHISKIPTYKKNHPGYKVIFLVFDESSLYGITENNKEARKNYKCGDILNIQIHSHVLDKRFIEVLANSDVDYLVWFTPYKHADFYGEEINIPSVTIIKIDELNKDEFIDYPESLVISTEE